MTVGDISVSIFNVGAEAFHFIQGIESRYRSGGNGSVPPVLVTARTGEFSVPQAASEGNVKAEASKAVIKLRMTTRERPFWCFSARAEPMI
ncbi:hypothetical protein [Bradyrhizobium sp. NAS96.2]|uniref:hypothetical protein n=1 Tax=Bradyrhizobium sp. NAS96.2 TaxID=1680160 RepID=UPI0011610AB2|nr:hypothetical protein [Bradyrhizobium sp. NAS96.2]